MRLVNFTKGDDWNAGFLANNEVIEVEAVARTAGWDAAAGARLRNTRIVAGLDRRQLDELSSALDETRDALRDHQAIHALEDLHLGPPITDPQKIICLGLNYRDHAKEAGLTAPATPMWFAKFANSLSGPYDDIVPPIGATSVDYEAEVAIVIGKRGRRIPANRAREHIAGAMAFNDVSERSLQLQNTLWTNGKAIDTFAPCGPSLVLDDEINDYQALTLSTRINGRTVQTGTTASMIFNIAETIAFLSKIMTLEPGDIIATGTPAGVGNARNPKLFLQPGDIVEVEVDGIGALKNHVVAPG